MIKCLSVPFFYAQENIVNKPISGSFSYQQIFILQRMIGYDVKEKEKEEFLRS